MRPSSAKAKGRRLQQFVATTIRERFGLAPDDVRPAIMGESGEDIKLSTAARAKFPFAVECKNTERIDIWGALAQAEANCGTACPLVVFKRNRSRAYAVIDFDSFMNLVGGTNANDGQSQYAGNGDGHAAR